MAEFIFIFCILFIFYVYFGYPLLITLLAQLRKAPVYANGALPSVTLLIAAYNEEVIIARKLENSFLLDYPVDKLQIIVAADGSDDRTPEIVRQFSERGVDLSYIPERGGKMAAINRAMPLVQGKIIVFSDANNMYESDVIKQLVAPFSEETVGLVNGAKVIITDDKGLGASEGVYWKYESHIKKQETRFGSSVATLGEIMAIRRELYQQPPDHIINDDFFMAMQIVKQGYRIVYQPKARSSETVSETAQGEITRRTRIIAGRYQALLFSGRLLPFKRPIIVWQVISHKFMRPLVPFAFIGAALANVIAVLWAGPAKGIFQPPLNVILLFGQICFYGMAGIGKLIDSKSFIGKILYIPTFLVNSNVAALRGLYMVLTSQNAHIWTRVQRSEVE